MLLVSDVLCMERWITAAVNYYDVYVYIRHEQLTVFKLGIFNEFFTCTIDNRNKLSDWFCNKFYLFNIFVCSLENFLSLLNELEKIKNECQVEAI